MFSKIKFPVSSFFPACGDSECAALACVNDDCGCGNNNNSNSNNNCGCRIVR